MSSESRIEPEGFESSLCMKLMCSQNRDEVEVVRNELLNAGIGAEIRPSAMAEELGVKGVELWVMDERNFAKASNVCSGLKGVSGTVGKSGAKGKRADGHRDVVGEEASGIKHTGANQARSLLEKGIQEMVQRESDLETECGALRRKVSELTRALAEESESRRVAEGNQEQQISALVRTLESERKTWQEQLVARDELVKKAELKIGASRQLFEAQREAVRALKEEIVSLELRQEEYEKSVCAARKEALAERDARIAAEERADREAQEKKAVEAQLLRRKDLEQEMQGHVASLIALCGRIETAE